MDSCVTSCEMAMLMRTRYFLADVIGRVLWSVPATWNEPGHAVDTLRLNQFMTPSILEPRGTQG